MRVPAISRVSVRSSSMRTAGVKTNQHERVDAYDCKQENESCISWASVTGTTVIGQCEGLCERNECQVNITRKGKRK